MCLESTKQRYVLFTTFAKTDRPHGMLDMTDRLEATSLKMFGTERYAYSPVSLETLVTDCLEVGALSLSRKGIAITEQGREVASGLKPFVKRHLVRERKPAAA